MWAHDADLVVLEPNLLRDVAWLGQVVSRGTGVVSGGILTATAVDPLFGDAGVRERGVVSIGGAALEIVLVSGPAELNVGRIREELDGAAMMPVDVASAPFVIVSFQAQIDWSYRRVLAMLGLKPPGAPLSDDRPGFASVQNAEEMRALVCYGALHVIYAAAGACEPGSSPWNQRAGMYRARFDEERKRVVARVDSDGDGVVDVLRRVSSVQYSSLAHRVRIGR